MSSIAARAACVLYLLFASVGAAAHEVRPSYLEIREDAGGQVRIVWKQPTVGDRALPLRPMLSSGWLAPEAGTTTVAAAHLVRRWAVVPPHAPLEGQRLTVEGLDRTMTDALVRIVYANGVEVTRLVKPEQPTFEIPPSAKSSTPAVGYLQLGIVHIWTGVDHLLYLLGLLLLVRQRAALIKTITAFTVAHSITLGAAALHLVTVPAAPVEALIALSIVYVAVELVYLRRGRAGFASRFPWRVAFAFGLLHGLGFAGALAEVGLPADDIPLALLCFNVGIELGQLAFVAFVLLGLRPALAFAPRAANLVLRATPHAIGSVAALWCIERTVAFM